MTRKGRISEILSNARYNDDPSLYLIGYQDFNAVKETTLPEFLKISENFEIIPATRIEYIKKNDLILYYRSKNKTFSK